jgi:hypothetical protein
MTVAARFLALPASDRRLCVRSLAVSAAVRAGLGLFGYAKLRAWLERVRIAERCTESSRARDDAARIARFVRASARHLPGGRNCLVEALTLWWLLRRRGIESEIRIGVRREPRGLDAHAWVECGGGIVLDEADASAPFAPLVRPTAT